ncbi:MAG: protein-L-isoaspartate(D-aspartate) O-methyltransferase [Schleiferiaceae bacterium]|nr:protein-L-isoaspartate(D-aspartate) O-methyltransferase [Schleiferiaceae bacterium]
MRTDSPRHQGQRLQLVEQLRERGIMDEGVLDAISQVPRHLFLDSSFEQYAYRDAAFPIRAQQTISQPYTVAFQTEALRAPSGSKILEIGTGSGYQAAVLAAMGYKVYTIERQKELFDFSKSLLLDLGYRVSQKFGDGYKGMPAFAPFDGILVTAAAPALPQELLEQLRPGGRLIVPVGEVESEQSMHAVWTDKAGLRQEEVLGQFRFVPMLKDVNTGR